MAIGEKTTVKSQNEVAAVQKTWVRILSRGDSLEKEMATHSSILGWRIPWTEEPDGLQSIEAQRVRHDLAAEQQLPPWTLFS